jgi:hypothetical protein
MFIKSIKQKMYGRPLAAGLAILLALALAVGTAWALSAHSREVIKEVWHFKAPVRFGADNGLTYTFPTSQSAGAFKNDGSGTLSWGTLITTRDVQLPLASFIINGVPVTNATAPGIEVDDLIPGIVWADGETTPAQITFRVPVDYSTGGSFRVLATESDSTTPNEVDFSVYINSDGTAADAAATDQTTVALAGTTATADEVTLTVATDFAALAAGQYVTLNLWRDNTADGTGDLEVKGVVFRYSSAQ